MAYLVIVNHRTASVFLLAMCVFDVYGCLLASSNDDSQTLLASIVERTTSPIFIIMPRVWPFTFDDRDVTSFTRLPTVDVVAVGMYACTVYRLVPPSYRTRTLAVNLISMALGLWMTCVISMYRQRVMHTLVEEVL
jgi:hypothetical protein